jgi:methyl-accepting chemotaxis protein
MNTSQSIPTPFTGFTTKSIHIQNRSNQWVGSAGSLIFILYHFYHFFISLLSITAHQGDPALWISLATAGLGVAANVLVFLCLIRSQKTLAAIIMISSNIILLAAKAVFLPGNMVLEGITSVIVLGAFSGAVFPTRHISKGMLASVIGGVVVLIGPYIFHWRTSQFEYEMIKLFVYGAVFTIFLILLTINYSRFDLGAKFFSIGSTLSILTSIGSFVSTYFVIERLKLMGQFSNALLVERTLVVSSGAMMVLICVLFLALTVPISSNIKKISKTAQFIAIGDIRSVTTTAQEGLPSLQDQVAAIQQLSQDEFSDLAKNFSEMIEYQQRLSSVVEKVAEGDLTVSVRSVSNEDVLGNAFTLMLSKFKDAITRIAENAEILALACSELDYGSKTNVDQIDQISTTISQMVSGIGEQTSSIANTSASIEQMATVIIGVEQGATEQAKSVNKAAAVTHEINRMIHQVTEIATIVSDDSIKATDFAKIGGDKMNETVKGMQVIKEKVDLSMQKVSEMGDHSKQINAFVDIIEDIASQTNLLAVNAAIEAAHAGEFGHGFSVVATEGRKLSEKTRQSIERINSLAKGISNAVDQSLEAMTEGAKEVNHGVERANDTRTALIEIIDAIDNVSTQAAEVHIATGKMDSLSLELVDVVNYVSSIVEENVAATQQMATNSSEVMHAIETITEVSEQNQAAIEQVNSATEEMRGQSRDVTMAVNYLDNMAQSFRQLVSFFKFSDDGTK